MKTIPATVAYPVLLVASGIHQAAAAPIEIKISLDWKESVCVANVVPTDDKGPTYYLSRSKRDVPVWSFANNCNTAQKVHVCAIDDYPLTKCSGSDGAKINGNFKMKAATGSAATNATVICQVDWDEIGGIDDCSDCPRFPFMVVNGPANLGLDCPGSVTIHTTAAKPGVETRDVPVGSELAIETVP